VNRWRDELRATVKLAVPVAVGQLGIMAMALVDTAVVGELGASAVAAVGVANAVYGIAYTFGLGLLLGLDRVVAFASGAGRPEEVHRTMAQGLLLALAFSVPGMALTWGLSTQLPLLGVEPEVLAGAQAYLAALSWSLVPSMVFVAVRQSLQGLGETGAATLILLGANVVNYLCNLLFIRGFGPVPAMGIAGSGRATFCARLFMLLALLWVARDHLRRMPSLRPDRQRLRELLQLGVPAGLHLVVEGGVFAGVTLLAARLGAVPGAAHQIVLQIASFTFMVSLGISSAGSVRVGHALGQGDVAGARRAGWVAVALGVAAMACSSLGLLALGPQILGLFNITRDVLEVATLLLVCAGFFQIFDGAQAVLAGVLRGANDTRSAMVTNLFGHWAIGLPIGAVLCYRLGWGVVGLWFGLATGLALVALALAMVWHRRLSDPSRLGVALSLDA
jgi:MATE family multidrug resistance protein